MSRYLEDARWRWTEKRGQQTFEEGHDLLKEAYDLLCWKQLFLEVVGFISLLFHLETQSCGTQQTVEKLCLN